MIGELGEFARYLVTGKFRKTSDLPSPDGLATVRRREPLPAQTSPKKRLGHPTREKPVESDTSNARYSVIEMTEQQISTPAADQERDQKRTAAA
jgi:hypothetical protein